jgi:hypothetical protein
MGSQPVTMGTEAAIWARLIESQPKELTPDAARYLLALHFSESNQARLQVLADRSQEGMLSDHDTHDTREFDSYLHIANLLAVKQSRARLILDSPIGFSASFVNSHRRLDRTGQPRTSVYALQPAQTSKSGRPRSGARRSPYLL